MVDVSAVLDAKHVHHVVVLIDAVDDAVSAASGTCTVKAGEFSSECLPDSARDSGQASEAELDGGRGSLLGEPMSWA